MMAESNAYKIMCLAFLSILCFPFTLLCLLCIPHTDTTYTCSSCKFQWDNSLPKK